MKKLLICAILMLSAQVGFAAPLDRSIREIRDIVSSPELRRILPASESILDMRRVDRGYMLLTNHYQLFVEVMYGPYRGAEGGSEGGATNLRFEEPKEINK